MIITIRFGENVLGAYVQYISIFINFWGRWEGYMFRLTFFCLLFIKRKNYKSLTYTKIKFYFILSNNFFNRVNNNFLSEDLFPKQFIS